METLKFVFEINWPFESLIAFSRLIILLRGVSKEGAGGAIAPPRFGRIEGAAGSGAAPH